MSFFPKQSASRQGVTQVIAFTTATTITNGFGAETYQIRLCATAACHYLISEAANVIPATVTNAPLLPANWVEYVIVTPGQKLSVIQDSAGGNLSVTEMS